MSFFFTKMDSKKEKQVLSEELVPMGGWWVQRKSVGG
jgi:hypothetical protein